MSLPPWTPADISSADRAELQRIVAGEELPMRGMRQARVLLMAATARGPLPIDKLALVAGVSCRMARKVLLDGDAGLRALLTRAAVRRPVEAARRSSPLAPACADPGFDKDGAPYRGG